MNPSEKVIPITPINQRASESFESAKKNFAVILEHAPWLRTLDKEALGLAKENASAKTKYAKLVRIADRIAEAMAPSSACKAGCSHCCHRSVGISAFEAGRLSEASGRPIKKVERTKMPMTVAEDVPATACPFLQGDECSIYENRPIACRITFNISDDALFCDPALAPEGTQPPTISMDGFLMAYAIAFVKEPLADIRSFFEPAGTQA